MTEASVKVKFEGVASNLISNKTLYDIMYKQMLEIGVPTYTTEDETHAEAIYMTFIAEIQTTALVGLSKHCE